MILQYINTMSFMLLVISFCPIAFSPANLSLHAGWNSTLKKHRRENDSAGGTTPQPEAAAAAAALFPAATSPIPSVITFLVAGNGREGEEGEKLPPTQRGPQTPRGQELLCSGPGLMCLFIWLLENSCQARGLLHCALL